MYFCFLFQERDSRKSTTMSQAKRVCVIGAGPSGMSVLYHFNRLKTQGKEIPEIVCYDKQSDWGGLWKYSWEIGEELTIAWKSLWKTTASPHDLKLEIEATEVFRIVQSKTYFILSVLPLRVNCPAHFSCLLRANCFFTQTILLHLLNAHQRRSITEIPPLPARHPPPFTWRLVPL